MNIPILYQDDDFIVVNKPPGIMVHPWRGGSGEKSLMTLLKEQTQLWLYPVHRLDRPVSGVVLFALSSEAAHFMQTRWHSEEIKKKYLCLGSRIVKESGRFDFSLKSDNGVLQEALTLYKPLAHHYHPEFACTLFEVSIKTGRQHQIRRHFSRRNHNLICDTKYGKGTINRYFKETYKVPRMFLHSHQFSFPLFKENKIMNIEAPLAPDLQAVMDQMTFKFLS